MYRINEKIWDNSLNTEVIVTAELLKGMESVDPFLASVRWNKLDLKVKEATIVEEEEKEVVKEEEIVYTLEDLREQYKEKFNKKCPNNKKNDKKWILSKLN